MPTAAASNDHQRVLVTRWWFPRLSCALHRHQRVTTTRWWLPWPPSDHHHLFTPSPPLTTTNESLWLVGGFLGFHVPPPATNESRRLVGGFLGLHLTTTTYAHCPPLPPLTTTNESS